MLYDGGLDCFVFMAEPEAQPRTNEAGYCLEPAVCQAAVAKDALAHGHSATQAESGLEQPVRLDDQRQLDGVAPAGRRSYDTLTHIGVCNTIVCMNVDRLSITLQPELGAAVRSAASRAGMSVSAWLAEAASDRLRNDILGEALDRWEAEDGPFGDDELDAASAALGLSQRRGRRAS